MSIDLLAIKRATENGWRPTPGNPERWHLDNQSVPTTLLVDMFGETTECERCHCWIDQNFLTRGPDPVMCFSCRFWQEKVGQGIRLRDGEVILYLSDGGRSHSAGAHLGFGGRRWHIRMFDGTEIETNNMWLAGTVPEDWSAELCVNAHHIGADPDRSDVEIWERERAMTSIAGTVSA